MRDTLVRLPEGTWKHNYIHSDGLYATNHTSSRYGEGWKTKNANHVGTGAEVDQNRKGDS